MPHRGTPTTKQTVMQAAVYRGPNDIRVESVPVPTIEAGEVLVRVAACGVASTDVKKVEMGLLPPPLILGREIAGSIERVGPGVDDWSEGERVVVYPHVPCRRCFYCERELYAQCETYQKTGITAGFEPAGGGFAEFVRVLPWIVSDGGLVEVPKSVPFEQAIFVEPVNTCLRGIRLLDLDEEDVVLVAGCGALGLILQQLAIREGAQVVAADPLPGRLRLAKELGAVRTVDPRHEDMHVACKDLTDGRGADCAIVAAVGEGPARDAIRATRPGAKIVLFAQVQRGDEVAVDMGDICIDEKHVIGAYSASVDEADEAENVVFHREIELEPLVTDRFALPEAADAFRRAAEPAGDVVKVVVFPGKP
jgi:L-iditol 2-dehydrogenase